MTKKGVIGLNGSLPWYLPEDLKLFATLTKGYPVIMGRKTQNSIGFPLKERVNIVISSSTDKIQGCIVVHSFNQAIRVAKRTKAMECFVIGGAQIYALALPYADKMYISQVHYDYKGDTYFPEYENKKQWVTNSIQRKNTFDFITREKI
jgi:dihydrofolate reductase